METIIIMGYIVYIFGVIWYDMLLKCFLGIMDNKMETTIMGYIGYILGLYGIICY